MGLSVQQLRTPVTEDQALAFIIEKLQAVGFNATSWEDGSIQLKLLGISALIYSDLTSLVAAIADLGFNRTSSGDALTEYSRSSYANDRFLAVKTLGTMVLTNTGSNSYAIANGKAVVGCTGIDGVQRTFRNVTEGSLLPGNVTPTTLALTFEAETSGKAWNISPNSALTLVTPFAGVVATNPPLTGSTKWTTTDGTDDEPDATLQERNETKWSSMSLQLTKEGVKNVALTASAPKGVTRVDVDDTNPRGAGTVDVYLAAAADTATGAATLAGDPSATAETATGAAAVALGKRMFGSNKVLVKPAPIQDIPIVGTVYYYGDLAAVRAAVAKSLSDFAASIPLGGFYYSAGYSHIVPKEEIANAIRSVRVNGQQSVKAVVLTTPSADVSVSSWTVATLRTTPALTYVLVPV